MNRIKYFITIVFVALFLTGCIDTDDTFTINPDGSGKVMRKALISLDGMKFSLGDDLSDMEKLQNVVKDELKKAKGIDARLIKELSGTVDYLVGGATKKIDLGIGQFAADTTGTQFNARIMEIKPDDWNSSNQVLVLKIDKANEEIKEVIFSDASGQPIEVESRGIMYSESKTTYTFARKEGEFPSSGSIAIEAYADLQRKKISFTLNDLEIFKIK